MLKNFFFPEIQAFTR